MTPQTPVARARGYLLACERTGSGRDVLALARAMDAVARALDPEGGCAPHCACTEYDASGQEQDCDCGYVEAADDPVGYLRAALGRES